MQLRDAGRLAVLGWIGCVSVACGGTSGDPTAGGASAAGGAGSTGGDGGGAAASPSGVPPCGTDPAKQPARCVDSKGGLRCKTNSGYPGDELALCNPAEADGQLVHFGPSSYDDPAAMEPFMLGPGAEEEVCLHVNTTNTDTRYFATYHGRMRPHSHHWIVTMPNKHYADETKPWVCPPQPTDRWLFGSQSPQIDVAALTSGEVVAKPGDPDYGAAHDIPPAQTLLLDLHYVNTTDQPILREAWAELSYVDPADVKVRVDLIGFYNPGISLPPLAHATTKRVTCETPKDASGQQQPVYLGLTTGHAHQRLQRLSLWHQKVDGSSELVYESRNWHEPGEAVFRDGVPNPALPMAAGQDWGAKSGYLHVLPGENVSFECEYQNDRNATVTFGDTANDEMCNIFGFYYPTVGRMWNCF